jgi:hypothetical protein
MSSCAEAIMLETLAIVLVILWILGSVSSYTMGGHSHSVGHRRGGDRASRDSRAKANLTERRFQRWSKAPGVQRDWDGLTGGGEAKSVSGGLPGYTEFAMTGLEFHLLSILLNRR